MKTFLITYQRENSTTVTTVPTLESNFKEAVKTANLLIKFLKDVHHINAELLGVALKIDENGETF